MANVTDLTIKRQSGTDNSYYATWNFNDDITTTSSGSINEGDWVSIKSGATYYNGVSIPDWVMNDTWKVTNIQGDRAVLGENPSGTHNIVSPVNINDLEGGSGSSSTTTKNTLENFTVKWFYDSGDNVWFSGSSSDITEKHSIYSPPSNANRIKVSVKPNSKTHKVNDKDTVYWTGTAKTVIYLMAGEPPAKPSTPTVNIDKLKLTASVENISDPRTDQIEFSVYNDALPIGDQNGFLVKNAALPVMNVTTTVKACRASVSYNVVSGGRYRVRCRAINLNKSTKVYSEWSDFSSVLTTIPAPVTNVQCAADSETSVKVNWIKSSTAKSYKVEYTTNKTYFDSSTQVSSMTVTNNIAYVLGLDSGEEWFFRVCATNDKGDSEWSSIVSTVIGTDPAAPTTWSSTTTAIVGESLTLYWVHNSEDNSSQTYAELEIYVNDAKSTYTIQNTTDEDEKDKTSSYAINTSEYPEGTVIKWRVRTAGATKVYGDWSVQRIVNIYAKPTLELGIINSSDVSISTITSFPFYVTGATGPKTQSPIGYHLSITSDQSYETTDHIGNVKMVNAGDEIYSKYFDISTQLMIELSAGNINLEDGISYTITCTASMDSGLTAESTTQFNVAWTETMYEPNVSISIDEKTYSAYIRPYCMTGDGEVITDVMLSVYRREFDGGFTEIIKDIDNTKNIFITDPHPALDYARYRIVATSKSTGAISYYDAPGYPINGKAAIIQWDEEWQNLENTDATAQEETMWAGSILQLLYNIDVSDNNNPDVSLVNYIGRKHPVSYYGTQIGSTSTWNMSIKKDDSETLYALRRLQVWMGDCYVREPSGSGYWANVKVSFSQKHCDLTIPVTLSITRVEGGV